ncbi:MAG: NCS2 family permease [Verrucomicrobiota bacterium]|nr:NCS2 family permease [Verrucomicrobiota bacterium]
MKPSFFVRGDLDGFFGLFIDNLLQLMLIAVFLPAVCGFEPAFVFGTILPGAAISILFGNVYYSWQAWRMAKRENRNDITALPYGINTVSLVAFIFLIMAPIYSETKNTTLVWQAGIFACFLSGVIEMIGAFAGNWLRKVTPRAALLSALAGIAMTFIAMGFIFQLFASPAIAILPMMMILLAYAGGVKFPFSFPGGCIAVLVGVALGWLLIPMGWSSFAPSAEDVQIGLYLPKPVPQDLFALLSDPLGWKYFAIILPMSLFNIIGSLQNLESAEAAGDKFPTRSSLLVNGLGSIVASFFGSAFPTTIYIGHPGWKAMGARVGYSLLNGVVITALILMGGMTLVLKVVPIEATLGILLWIGLIIMAQAYQATPRKHALAVSMGLVPCLAAWALFLIETSLRVAGTSLFATAPKFGNDLFIYGIIALNQGFVITAMIFSAIVVYLVEKDFLKASIWCFAAAVLAFFGLIHAFSLDHIGLQPVFELMAAPRFVFAYTLTGIVFLAAHFLIKDKSKLHAEI